MKIKSTIFNMIFRSSLLVCFLLTFLQPCFAKNPPKIPDPLKPWVDWVLHDQEARMKCIPRYNDPENLQCNWPTELKIDLNDKGGVFRQSWQIYHESWISLPGNDGQWPQEV
ncbi:MAG TPA: hypothetical protein VMW42_03585, partial [Desulfatiglandales bacterium]|nr:hypothetical protein [Desulfatiglandales bacterium]